MPVMNFHQLLHPLGMVKSKAEVSVFFFLNAVCVWGCTGMYTCVCVRAREKSQESSSETLSISPKIRSFYRPGLHWVAFSHPCFPRAGVTACITVHFYLGSGNQICVLMLASTLSSLVPEICVFMRKIFYEGNTRPIYAQSWFLQLWGRN